MKTKNKSQGFVVNEDMIFYAFRYALGRKTHAVGTVSDYLIDNWHKFKTYTKEKIRDEIKESIENNRAGMDIDIKMWRRILTVEDEN